MDFARPGFRREKCAMLSSASETPLLLDTSRHFWAANRRPREADQGHFYLVETVREYGGARQRDGRDADRLQEVASGEDGRPMRLRTPAIRCDRPPVQGSPALLSRPTSTGQVPADPPAKNHAV